MVWLWVNQWWIRTKYLNARLTWTYYWIFSFILDNCPTHYPVSFLQYHYRWIWKHFCLNPTWIVWAVFDNALRSIIFPSYLMARVSSSRVVAERCPGPEKSRVLLPCWGPQPCPTVAPSTRSHCPDMVPFWKLSCIHCGGFVLNFPQYVPVRPYQEKKFVISIQNSSNWQEFVNCITHLLL